METPAEENRGAVETEVEVAKEPEPFLRLFSCTRHPALKVQHSEKNADGDMEDHEFNFHHGVLRIEDEETHDRFLRCLKKMHPSVRNQIVVQGDRSAAEAIAAKHAAMMRRENAAVQGPFQSTHLSDANPEAEEAKLRTEAAGQGAVDPNTGTVQVQGQGNRITPAGLKSLFAKPANGLAKAE